MTVPLQGRVVIRRVPPAEETATGTRSMEGEVVAVGAGMRYANGVLLALEIKPGDRVLFGMGTRARIKLGGEDLMIMKEADVRGLYRAAAKKLAA